MNFEQKLAQTIINNIETYESMVEFLKEKGDLESARRWSRKKRELENLATQMWGEDVLGQFSLEFIKNLEKIAKNPSESFKHQIMDAFQSGVEFKRNMEITIGEEAEKYYKSLF